MAKSQPQCDVRQRRHGRARARLGRLFSKHHRHTPPVYPLSWRRFIRAGCDCWAGRSGNSGGLQHRAASTQRQDQDLCGADQDALGSGARNSHHRRSGRTRALFTVLAWSVGAQEHAHRRNRQAQCCGRRGARRSRRAREACRLGAGDFSPRAADAAGARRLSQGRNREVVADHQGREHQGRINPARVLAFQGSNMMKLPRRQFMHLAAGAAALPVVSRFAWAQAYPTRPVRLIVPFPAAGPSDVLARLYGQKLSQRWNQPVVVENRVGATGTIGTEAVVRAPPDGYTLLFTADLPITMAPALLTLRYDPQRDLVPVAALAKNDALLVVHPSTGIRSLADLVAAAKAKPGALTFASAGKASPSHLCGEMLKRQADIDMTHVPYSGAAPAMNAVLAGDVTMYCAPIPVGVAHFKAGKVYAFGVTGTAPSPLLPDLSPLSAIYPGFVISNWQALFAPVATPPAVTQLVRDELKKAYADPELQQKLAILALEPAWLSGAELSQRIEADTAKWMDLFKSAGAKVE